MNDPSLIYIDNHILAVNKPAGWLTQPDKVQANVETWAKDWIKKTYHKPGNVFLHAIHRLDKPVSGVLLFARTSKALSRLNTLQRQKRYRKTYWAIVEGISVPNEGTLEHYLVHDAYEARVVEHDHPQALHSCLHFRLIAKKQTYSWVEIELETGRYHQIRIQMATSGWPIVGDIKYGSTFKAPLPGILLHHRELCFVHPITYKNMSFIAPLPEGWPEVSETSLDLMPRTPK